VKLKKVRIGDVVRFHTGEFLTVAAIRYERIITANGEWRYVTIESEETFLGLCGRETVTHRGTPNTRMEVV
jgi:hypothetical protein